MRSAEAVVPERPREASTAKAEHKSARVAAAAPYTVFIRDLEIATRVGAFAHERTKPTVLWMDIDIDVASRAGATDKLGDAVDYGAVVTDLRRCMASKRYFLLEKVSEFVANRILEKFGVLRVRVSVAKVGIVDGVGRVGVRAERSS